MAKSLRQLKKKIKKLLLEAESEQHLDAVLSLPGRQVVNPLFSFFYNKDQLIKWRSVTLMGSVTDRLAKQDMESARVILRRLMWNLNDESGGIGWGSPEAMGDIMARNALLAGEYCNVLMSYILPDGNYLEHEMLQRGVLWGLGRLSHARPGLVKFIAGHLNPFMASKDAVKRGLAAWTAEPLRSNDNKETLNRLIDDDAEIEIYGNWHMHKFQVSELAKAALENL